MASPQAVGVNVTYIERRDERVEEGVEIGPDIGGLGQASEDVHTHDGEDQPEDD